MYQTPKKPVPIKLSDLPLELQIHILSLLEWGDVLRARQVGQSLKTRIFLILLYPSDMSMHSRCLAGTTSMARSR
jgi:hypothetical protein